VIVIFSGGNVAGLPTVAVSDRVAKKAAAAATLANRCAAAAATGEICAKMNHRPLPGPLAGTVAAVVVGSAHTLSQTADEQTECDWEDRGRRRAQQTRVFCLLGLPTQSLINPERRSVAGRYRITDLKDIF
jgi:hypothetical protein